MYDNNLVDIGPTHFFYQIDNNKIFMKSIEQFTTIKTHTIYTNDNFVVMTTDL